MDALHCACGQTDIVRRDHITGASLCFACSAALTDFMHWLRDDVAMARDLGRMMFIYRDHD